MGFLKMLGIKKSVKSTSRSADNKKIISDRPSSSEVIRPNREECINAFLSLFVYPQRIDGNEWIASWSESLGKPYNEVIADFVKQDFLRKASVKDKLGMKSYVQDLKQTLKQHGLKVSGNKDELLDRFIEAMPREAEEKASMVVGDLYVCTSRGVQKAEEYRKRMDERRNSAEQEARKLLAQGKVDEAVETVARFKLQLPRSHAGDVPNRGEVKTVMEIKGAPGLTESEVKEGRINTAIQLLWDRRITRDDSLSKYARFQLERKESINVLKSYSEQEFITRVEVICCKDACRKCRAVANKKYSLDQVPLIPIDGCTNENGCRCSYVPIVD